MSCVDFLLFLLQCLLKSGVGYVPKKFPKNTKRMAYLMLNVQGLNIKKYAEIGGALTYRPIDGPSSHREIVDGIHGSRYDFKCCLI